MTNLGKTPHAARREYVSFPQAVDATPRARSGRTVDDATSREAIRRPIGATPRRKADWR